MLRARPVTRVRDPIRMRRRRRRWERVSWWYSSIFVVALLLVAWRLMSGGGGSDALSVKVFDASSGKALAGAVVTAGEVSGTTDGDGVASLSMPSAGTVVSVQMNGYAAVHGTYAKGFSRSQSVSLHLLAPVGGDSEENSQAPPTGPASSESSEEQPTAGATVSPPIATTETSTGDAIATGPINGVVTGADGKGLEGALIRSDKTVVHTGADGAFSLDSSPASGKIVVSKSGYRDLSVDAGQNPKISLERFNVKAVYLNGSLAGDDDTVNRFIDLIDRTELNAVVIDIKEGDVYYNTRVRFFSDAGVVHPTYDPAAVIKKFHDHGIYVIARQVVFKDPAIAAFYPDLAVKDTSGGLWKGSAGDAWVNPFQKGLWQPNVDMALEAAGLGFDEVQFDYIRFPSDGDLKTSDFGPDYSEEGRVGAIVNFLTLAHQQLEPSGAKLAVDVFGIVAVYPDDQGIGQRLVDIAPVVDYLCPMVYPSHFDPTSIDVGGEPNDHPYETVSLALTLLAKRIPGEALKIRPWLQDFSLSGMTPYGAAEVDDQIKAAMETGSGWLLWNEGGDFTEDALTPDAGPNS